MFFSLENEDIVISDSACQPRINRQIASGRVRVIGADGTQLGVLELEAALRMAEEQGLDLVEVGATAKPPVVRIMDYATYGDEMAKQARLAHRVQHRFRIDPS